MEVLSVCLILIGIAAIVVSYFISDRVAEERMKQKTEELIMSTESQELIRRRTRETVEDVLGTLSEDITANVERELGRMSNEKIMAVHDYSETVLGEINKSHNEVMFLYSMLDEKDKEVKQTAAELNDVLKTAGRANVKSSTDNRQSEGIDTADLVSDMSGGENQTSGIPGEPAEVSDNDATKNINDNSRETILRLSSEGYSNVEIAKQLKMGVGEVQLVVGLFQGANK